MIYNQIINYKNINIKKKLKYSEYCTLIPIKYNNNDLIIQTPKMYIPYGEKYVYNNINKKYVDISFLNIENDDNIKIFYDNLNIIYDKINNFYNRYNLDDIIKKYNKNELLRLKMSKDILIYDQNKKNIDKIINNTYGSFIIHLQGLWLMNDTLYFHWELLQCKLDMPIYLSEYSFIEDVKPIINKGNTKGKSKGKDFIPPPPPINSKYDRMIKMGIPKEEDIKKMRLEDTPKRINANDLQNVILKKTVIKEKDKIDDMPYLAELLKRIKIFSNV